MQDMRGKVKRSLAKLSLPGDIAIQAGDELKAESGAKVGSVTSVSPPASLGQARVAIAQLRAPHFEPGSTVYVGETPVITAALWG